MHPAWRRCSSLTHGQYAHSSRLATRAPRRPRCTSQFASGAPVPSAARSDILTRTCTAPLLALCGLLLGPQQPQGETAIRIGIWYGGPGALPPAAAAADLEIVRADLATIRRAGFNAITTWIAWRDAEPARGAYAMATVERLIAAAAQN